MEATKSLKPLELSTMPDPLASNSEKLTPEYGCKIASSMEAEWFGANGMITKDCRFNQRHKWVHEMRLFNRGEQSVEDVKNLFARQPLDLQFTNMDYEPVNYAKKFTNHVINGIDDEFYNIDVRSFDRFAVLEKQKTYDRHKTNMLTKPMLERAKALGLPDLTPKGFVPDDENELNLYSEIKERPKQEIAEEILISYVKRISKWKFTKKTTDKDLVLCDLQAARVFTDPNNGVMVDYINPANAGHSYVERNDFSDAYYFFVVDTITINDLRRESGFSDGKCRDIAKTYAGQNKADSKMDFAKCGMEQILNFNIQVMRFVYKGDREVVYKNYIDKKNRTRKVAKRDSDWQVPEGAENSRMSRRLDTWYEGTYVVGSEKYIYDYKEFENLARDEMNVAISPIIMQASDIYENRLKSFLSDIVALCKDLFQTQLKIQHLRSELKPDLVSINLDQLAELEIPTKNGKKESAYEMAMSILNVKGIIFEKTIDLGDEGAKQQGAAARPQGNQQGSALTILLNVWAHTYNNLREVTGILDINANSLVGTNQLRQLASNTATKHLVDAAVMFDQRVCEVISTHVKGVFTFPEANHIRKIYTQAVGKENVEAVESLKGRSNAEFGFSIEMVPAKEELDELKMDLQNAMATGSIDVSDKQEILAIARSNMKRARYYMSFIRRRNIKERMKELEYSQKVQSQSNTQAAQAKQQGDMQLYQARRAADLQFEGQKMPLDVQRKAGELQVQAPYDEQEFQRQAYLEMMKNQQALSLTKYKEGEKDKREEKTGTRQSMIAEQRQKDLPAFDFTKPDFDLDSILN